MANLIALFYNWWNLCTRFFDEHHHREAISSRPALMQGVARQVQSTGQRTIKVSLLHEKGAQIEALVTRTSRQLHEMKLITERWSAEQKWSLLLTRLLHRWLGGKWLAGLPPESHPALRLNPTNPAATSLNSKASGRTLAGNLALQNSIPFPFLARL